MSALLMLQFNPGKCPCCFDVQQYDGATRGPCHADCMPFAASYPGCPSMSFTGSTCRATALMSGASLSYTPKCARDFGADVSGAGCVYKSDIQTNADCNCSGQWAQYCIDDETGYRGRSWVVEFWCKDNDTLTVTNYNVVVTDWQCLCDGAAHGFSDGAGARFAWDLTIGGCCCDTCSVVENFCCPDDPISTTLTISDGTNSTTLTWDGASSWVGEYNGSFAGIDCSPDPTPIYLTCFGSPAWDLGVGCFGNNASCVPTGTCTPFLLECTLNGYAITITE